MTTMVPGAEAIELGEAVVLGVVLSRRTDD